MLTPVAMTLGADPELFVEKDGTILGSEKIIPKAGLSLYYSSPYVVRDGIQVELNPPERNTVSALGTEIGIAFKLLQTQLLKHPGVRPKFAGVVEVTRDELDSLSPDSQILGCQPSENVYGVRPITVDAKEYRKRSAGGHAHFGLTGNRALFNARINVISHLDIFLGNFAVLLDRDPGVAERRENYGRAGEYRIQPHGIEYRTPSNFWLRHYVLMDFVYGMAGVAFSLINHDLKNDTDIEGELVQTVNIENVIQAINTSDFELAKRNVEVVRPFIAKHVPKEGFPIHAGNIDKFLMFAEDVRAKGLDSFFPQDPVDHWIEGKQVGFADFLDRLY